MNERHCYILDYCNGSIFHCIIPKGIKDEAIEQYICVKYDFVSTNIHYMIIPEEVDIINI